MALLAKLLLFFLLLANAASFFAAQAQMEDAALSAVAGDSMDWPSSFPFAPQMREDDDEGFEFYGDGETGKSAKRSLFWHRMRFYISYAALSANRVPCPPRSGRSYYTHNCYRARGPVHPYSRNCLSIARCRR